MKTHIALVLLAASLLIVAPLRAQFVADGATNTLSNVTNTFPGDVTVGTNGSFTLLVLSDNALLTNSVNGLIGRNVTAKSNEVQLLSASARWRMGGSLFVGSNGASSLLVVSNGALLEDGAGTFGFRLESSDNLALVTGNGSLWTNRNGLDIGGLGRGNQMIVSNGGWVVSRSARMGVDASSSNNFVLVNGSGSVWSNALNLSVGNIAPGNRLVIEAGGLVNDDTGIVGDFNSASNNEALVTGPGSLWINRSGLGIGSQIGHNRLVVSNGASVWSGQGSVGSVSNQVIVTGAGSIWSNQTFLFVSGGSNRVDVSNGGWLADATGDLTGKSNTVTLAGGGSGWNNSDSLLVGDFGDGNTLIASNGATVLSSNATIGASTSLGNNNFVLLTDAGTLWSNRNNLTLGNHSFGNRLVVSNGATVFTGGDATLGANGGANTNSVSVSDPGTLWLVAFNLYVGSNGVGNTLLMTNGGTVFASNVVYLGFNAFVTNNRIANSGGNLKVQNTTGTGVLDLRHGTCQFNSGLIDVDQLVMTNRGTNVVFTGFGNASLNNIPTGSTASQYPSTINVSGLAGITTKVIVTLSNLSHTFPSDLDILLVSPTGQRVMLMSDAGSGDDISNVRLTFDDASSTPLPFVGPIATGTYRPTDYDPGEDLPAPALPGPYSVTLSSFNGSSPNGTWKLYINDDANPDSGSLVGWGLQIATDSSPVLDRGTFEFNGGTLITRGAVISNGAPFVVGTSGTTPAVWDVRAGVTNTFVGGDFFVGSDASFNQLILTNGALMTNLGYATLGQNTVAKSNSATLAGASSGWLLHGGVIVGRFGSGSRLVVSNGATLVTGSYSSIGHESTSTNNEAVIAGPGTTWTSGLGQLLVGGGGRNNRLLVSDGAQVVSYGGSVGDFFPDTTNNLALVTGSGSSWSNTTDLYVGNSGARNWLVVSNSGAVFAGNAVYLGFAASATNNRAVVDGGTLRATNASGLGLLDVRRGTFTLNSGRVEVDQLLMTNALGSFFLNGGTLSSRNTTFDPGSFLNVGNNVGPATFLLAGNGIHVFGSLEIDANSFLIGNGTVGGPVLTLNGGTISPGTSIGKMIFTNSPLLFGTILMEISKTGATLTNDQLQVTTTLTYNGVLTVTNIGPTALTAGDKFKFFTAPTYLGAFDTLNLPPLNAGLGWTNKLLVDGSIEVVVAPQPKFSNISVTGTNVIITGTNGLPGADYTVLTATNAALPLSNWVSLVTNQFGAGGGFSFTNGIAPGEPERFFRIRTP